MEEKTKTQHGDMNTPNHVANLYRSRAQGTVVLLQVSTSSLDNVTALHQAGHYSVTQFCTHWWGIIWIERKSIRNHWSSFSFIPLLCCFLVGKDTSFYHRASCKVMMALIFDPQSIDWDWMYVEDSWVTLRNLGGGNIAFMECLWIIIAAIIEH